MLSRRLFLGSAAAAPAAVLAVGGPNRVLAAETGLSSITGDAKPIGADERRARIAKLQELMGRQKIGALLVESGSSLDYFTGIRWWRSERTTAAVIPAKGEVIVVTPAFEEPSIRETLQIGGDVRPWNEHESPFQHLADALRDRGVASGTLAVEPTIRFFIIDRLRQAAPHVAIVSGDALVRACRMHKSPAELALLRIANQVTMQAIRYAHGKVAAGMKASDIAAAIMSATEALGGEGEEPLVLLNEASAYPHGSRKPQEIRDGSTVLVDCGCSVHGYQSDISRSWVFGTPSDKQRKMWDTVRRGQQIVFETAKSGVPCGSIDDAVRGFYEKEGWGPGYHLPGLPHRTGHGIGMDGHESPYLVHGDDTPLEPGMCFSDEPGLYVPGEFGIRLEDCWFMSETGPQGFTPFARSIDEPV
jgi:Xaa-Pro dipeptidase